MTPKEKAENLIDSFYWELDSTQLAKQCSLVCIDELSKTVVDMDKYEYYEKVKKEIHKF